MTSHTFGNDPAKTARYLNFWTRGDAKRPLIGFSQAGWFPVRQFTACRAWEGFDYLTPSMIDIAAFLDDHIRLLREGEAMDDDLIRGACPGQLALLWLAGILGRPVRILPDTTVPEDGHMSWPEALGVRFDADHPWARKYLEYADALVRLADGRFPISHAADLGPTDLHAVLRGHTQSVFDLADEPENSAQLLMRLGEVFCEYTRLIWDRLPLWQGGYFDAQYSLWSPGPIVRMQEDATAVYSPRLYRRFAQPADRMIAGRFASSFIHLHSTSMFLLDDILAIDEIKCFEVNRDQLGPPLAAMIPHWQKIQAARKPLLIRGCFTEEELRQMIGSLDPRGLFLNIMVNDLEEAGRLRPLVGI